MPLPDQAARDAFIQKLDHNVSIIAPAGVGKTTAVVERIANIAEQGTKTGQSLLRKLLLVTYTNKSALEMRERARERLLSSESTSGQVMSDFNQAFFGTIHSFCLELLRRWGHVLGLPPSLQLIENDELLWSAFLSSQDKLLDCLSHEEASYFKRLVDLDKVCSLARGLEASSDPIAKTLPSIPFLDFSLVLSYRPKNKRSIKTCEAEQERLSKWLETLNQGTGWLGLPSCSRGGKEFIALWETAFEPLRDWLAEACLKVAHHISRRLLDYRLSQGLVSYSDMLDLAAKLVAHSETGAEIRHQGYHVILDEAQDTDPVQFEVLLGVAQAASSTGKQHFPPPGRFCMVGDPQQSIYHDRADLATYLAAHESLVSSTGGIGEAFTVTMRCDHDIVDWVNQIAPEALNGSEGQVSFVPLSARPGCGEGSVTKKLLQPTIAIDSRKTALAADNEATVLAEWLAGCQPTDFGVTDWADIALLSPRKTRLASLAKALEAAGVPCQNHSRQDSQGDEPGFAWAAGLITAMAQAHNAFEIAGVLREVFSIKDSMLAVYVAEQSRPNSAHPLSLLRKPSGSGIVAQALNELWHIRMKARSLPLREAVELIFRELQLSERLSALPDVDDAVLYRVRALATEAEENGTSLREFAKQLRIMHGSSGGEVDPESGQLQLLTCQKAKGLEWPVVIVPYLFAPISQPVPSYPRLLPTEDGGETLAFDSSHDQSRSKAYAEKRDVQSFERLLYVTMTRPRNRLVLINDEAFFPDGKKSFGAHLRIGANDANRTKWQNLLEWSAAQGVADPQNRDSELGLASKLWVPEQTESLEVSTIKRVLPSSLARHEQGQQHERSEHDRLNEPEYPEIARSNQGGVGYGNWWHGMMEDLPWATPTEWPAFCQQRAQDSLFAERGLLEIDRFLKCELADILAKADCIRTEVPVLWRANEAAAYDGSIDLLAQLSPESWLIVDWKTDKVGNDPCKALLQSYGPQLGAYRDALKSILGDSVSACLYSTRTGKLAHLS